MADRSDDFQHVLTWIGRHESRDDVITAAPAAALAATLDHDAAPPALGDELPPLWHWLYFLPLVPQSQLGPDGHPARGGFLPPVKLPRRMWAGSDLTFHHPLAIGEQVRRDSTILDIRHKRGRSGDLLFVVVRHDVHDSRGCAITEEQHIVYREAAASSAPIAPSTPAFMAPPKADWQRVVHPNPVLLFRYSALTFNGHRIHYDRPYATGEEGYTGLVVQGPLLATLLIDVLREANPGCVLMRFEFRAQRPLFDTTDFVVAGTRHADGTCSLWVTDLTGAVAMEAEAVTQLHATPDAGSV